MQLQEWKTILTPYEYAVEELKVKFKNVRKELRRNGDYSPIEFVTGRVKKVSSILSKAKRLNVSLDNIENGIEDIAGIRIMCQFVEDIYTVVNMIKNREDMTVMYEKDYIKNYKDSGYRSYHIIVKYPFQSTKGKKEILAEIQIRTLAMNFWATIEHSLKYKFDHDVPKEISTRLRSAADAAFKLDEEMSEIRETIVTAQVMFEIKSLAIREILDNIQKLNELGYIKESIEFQEKFNKISNVERSEELYEFKEEIENIINNYKRGN